MDANLDAALQALDDLNANKNVVAVEALEPFFSAVGTQRGNQIAEADANSLIAAAQGIIDLLSVLSKRTLGHTGPA